MLMLKCICAYVLAPMAVMFIASALMLATQDHALLRVCAYIALLTGVLGCFLAVEAYVTARIDAQEAALYGRR